LGQIDLFDLWDFRENVANNRSRSDCSECCQCIRPFYRLCPFFLCENVTTVTANIIM
jgi:hypothetical protein